MMDRFGRGLTHLWFLDPHDVGLVVLAIGYGVAKGDMPAFWEWLVPSPRPRVALSDTKKEQIRLFATYLNTIGAGFMVTGVVSGLFDAMCLS